VIVSIDSRDEIGAFCRRHPELHLYEIGDLDPFFWPHTTWYALREGGDTRALALLYTGCATPTLLALCADDEVDATRRLVADLAPILPGRLYAHLTPGVEWTLSARYRLTPRGRHLKMLLREPGPLDEVDTSRVTALGPGDAPEVTDFYRRAYPENWFEARMLETGCYRGVRDGPDLVCVAGVHVHSPSERVAALGNIATDPGHRRRGHARAATAALCRDLLGTVDHLGLNVHEANDGAIACYEGLGFEPVAAYAEFAGEQR
jgi:ribosomal protein S18 acetylase RimI-like enzyme